MTQRPFTRPGAIDLSALKRPATQAAPTPAPPPGGAPGAGGARPAASSYAVTITEQNFQEVIESSMTAPVLLVFFSRTRMPESGQLADDLETVSAEFEGRFLAGLVDIDATPAIAQAMQIPSIPLVVAVVDGRPAPLFQDVVPLEELRGGLTQVMQQLTVQGITGRHQPRHAAAPEGGEGEDAVDPRYAAADAAMAAGDADAAVAEFQKLLTANPADAEAAAGLATALVLQRTQGVDPDAARAAAAAAPDDVDAQLLVADLDLLVGEVDGAFGRLVDLVRRTSDAERTRAREHLLSLFAAVGNDDPRVLRGRQNLASALF